MSSYIVPLFILFVIVMGLIEKKNIYTLFIEGVFSGLKVVYNIFPYIFAITILSGLLRDSNILANISFLGIDTSLLPLVVMKPLSGGASTSVVIDIFNNLGSDSFSGIVASILMSSTETTLYVISIMSSKTKIHNMKIVIICGLIGDITAVIMALVIGKILVSF